MVIAVASATLVVLNAVPIPATISGNFSSMFSNEKLPMAEPK